MNESEKIPNQDGAVPVWAEREPDEETGITTSAERSDIPELPISPLEKEADKLYREKRAIEGEISKKAFEYEKKLKVEHPTLGTIDEKWRETLRAAAADKERLLADFYERARRGDFGSGELAVIDRVQGESRLARVLVFKNKFDKNEARQIENNSVDEYNLLAPGHLSESAHLVELPLGGTTKEEYERLFQSLKPRYNFAYLMKLFEHKFVPTLKAGEIVHYTHVEHHSGALDSFAIVLPTGRLAVLSEYSGENLDIYGPKQFWGVISDPTVIPEWSAKYGGLMNTEILESPTKEEIAFLRREKLPVEVRKERLLAEDNSQEEAEEESEVSK